MWLGRPSVPDGVSVRRRCWAVNEGNRGEAVSDYQVRRSSSFPRKNVTPAPNYRPAAVALRSPYCLANVPRTPQRTPRPPTPGPIRPQHPEKTVTFPLRPCLGPDPPLTHARPTSSPRLRHFFPPIRPDPANSPPLLKYPHIRAIIAHARDRPRCPESLQYRRGIPCGCPASLVGALRPLWAPCGSEDTAGRPFRPLSCSATRRDTNVPNCPRRHYRIARDRRRSQLRIQQSATESNRFRPPAKPVPVKACPEPAEWACPEAPLSLSIGPAEWAGSGDNCVGGAW